MCIKTYMACPGYHGSIAVWLNVEYLFRSGHGKVSEIEWNNWRPWSALTVNYSYYRIEKMTIILIRSASCWTIMASNLSTDLIMTNYFIWSERVSECSMTIIDSWLIYLIKQYWFLSLVRLPLLVMNYYEIHRLNKIRIFI